MTVLPKYEIHVEKVVVGRHEEVVRFLASSRYRWETRYGEGSLSRSLVVASGTTATEAGARRAAELAAQNHASVNVYPYDPARRRTRVRTAVVRYRGQRWDEPDI